MTKLNCFTPGEIWPDNNGVHINAHGGGMLVHDGVVYWYGEHKIEGKAGNAAQVGVHVYSSRDLYNWRDEGIALTVSDDPDSDITKGCVLERPKVIYNQMTSKFVMWFHLELKGQGYHAARTAVAVSDSPVGPFEFIKSFRMNAGYLPLNGDSTLSVPIDEAGKARLAENHWKDGRDHFPVEYIFRRDYTGGQMARDMQLFVDDDQKAYHLAASEENATLHISELTDDYQSYTGRFVRVFPKEFNEAPAIFKHKGKYYLFSSDCTGWAPNPARVASADTIFGPWTYLGNPCRGTPEQNAVTFDSQSTYVLPVPNQPGKYIFMADRWRPDNAIDGRYIWLPVDFEGQIPVLHWHDRWDLSSIA